MKPETDTINHETATAVSVQAAALAEAATTDIHDGIMDTIADAIVHEGDTPMQTDAPPSYRQSNNTRIASLGDNVHSNLGEHQASPWSAEASPQLQGQQKPPVQDTVVLPEPEDITAVPDYDQPVLDQLVFKWDISNWSSLPERHHSPMFSCGGYRWKVLLFPQGNKNPYHVSAFLESVDASDHIEAGTKWHCCASFAIRLANTSDGAICSKNSCNRSILESDALTVVISLKVLKDELGTLWHSYIDWDSRKETGHVGIRNQGATCYLNSLLQSLYFTSYFRKATYLIPTENDEPQKSVPLALQRLFYNMQFSDGSVSTTELTKSFGWDTTEAFYQHDVQELNRVLQDNLESKMKGTTAEGAIRKLFTGKMKSYIRCIDVDFESSRVEDFYDIQLNVKGCKNLHDSFVEYCAVETMDGENKYFAEGFGLQDAKKGVVFSEFPPVLHLQLKRFEYDIERDALVKMNDRHEFPLEIELDEFLEEPNTAVKQKYHLHGVLVHSGELHAGHYCAFIRPEKNGKWFKYDDDRVIPVFEKEVLEDTYGGDIVRPNNDDQSSGKPMYHSRVQKHFTNAYMLVYIRESDIEEILTPITESDIPDHLRRLFDEERIIADRKKRDREESHLYLNINLVTDDDMRQYEGHDLCSFDEKSPSTMHAFRMKRDDTLHSFKNLVSEELHVPIEQIHLWNIIVRQNKTIRPDAPLRAADDSITLEDIRGRIGNRLADMRFYAEVSEKPIEHVNGVPSYISPIGANGARQQLLLFIKYYDPIVPKLEFLTSYTVKNKFSPISDLLPHLLKLKGFPADTSIVLYEEIKVGMIEAIQVSNTFEQCELVNGDVICFQREIKGDQIAEVVDTQLLTAPGYYELLSNRINVEFKPKSTDMLNKGDFMLVLSKKMLYDAAMAAIAKALDWDPFKIRLWPYNGVGPMGKAPLRRTALVTLGEMLGVTPYMNQTSPVVLYEMLDVSILELETKKYIKVLYVDMNRREHGPFDIFLLKTSRVEDILTSVAARVPSLVADPKSNLRLFDASNFRIKREYKNEELIEMMANNTPLIVDQISEEELNMASVDKVAFVCHFFKEPSRGHGSPFHFVLKPGEMFSETKKRLFARSHMSERDFEKVKFYFLAERTKQIAIEDDDILHDKLLSSRDMIGMDHPDKSIRIKYGVEKSIKILVSAL
ncbi:hypothetical protein BSLG_009535 [Batrachochytrium salamandrivorans]|nr:hypothetical protein BSLG_009535 [Batrachochytrium salamandrivorans]